MGKTPAPTNLTLPATFSARLFDGARKVHLDAGQTLFLVGDPGDGCYWVDEGLLKVRFANAGLQAICEAPHKPTVSR